MKLDHEEFASFWKIYPRRIAKVDAMKAFVQARKVASVEQILTGAQRYLDHLPDEAQFIPYPASWLRAGRYDDEYEIARPKVTTISTFHEKAGWFKECARMHGNDCDSYQAHVQRLEKERGAA